MYTDDYSYYITSSTSDGITEPLTLDILEKSYKKLIANDIDNNILRTKSYETMRWRRNLNIVQMVLGVRKYINDIDLYYSRHPGYIGFDGGVNTRIK